MDQKAWVQYIPGEDQSLSIQNYAKDLGFDLTLLFMEEDKSEGYEVVPYLLHWLLALEKLVILQGRYLSINIDEVAVKRWHVMKLM
jgi:hypothetical protein